MFCVALFALFASAVSALPLGGHNHVRRCHHGGSSSASAAITSSATSASASSSSSTKSKFSSFVTTESATASASPSPSVTSSSVKASASAVATDPSNLSTSSSSSSSTLSSLLSILFPVSQSASSSWSTVSGADNSVPLSDSTFQLTNLISALSHDYVQSSDSKLSMQAHYPKGSYTFTHSPEGGLSFYAPGPDAVDLTTAKEATFGYSVMFEDGFEWQKGGKLPGLFGGDSYDDSISCSGGRRSDACFSARLMWRAASAGELYTYLPPYDDASGDYTANKAVCDVAPFSTCNPTYGASVGRGAFSFVAGGWTTISQRVRLNDVGQANGELELFVGGESVINVSGLILRARDAGRIRGVQMQTFFGGSTEDYASPKDQNTYFSDFSVAITETL
ncbi:uncharacterized protein STEHIDRAFT_133994 [Stereum hirsutum FP-91666 SS1]|uniref:uncharacterized protein n=1 Tax=Stereum hirsutum (strain FP-91666) TaxID=721885 RepID=UPI000444A319|nr:uncharacterized protein STEHIDRAFT_133994 [Stereum hirsutum FP-91666 SS1]EIM82378.1 hypothetical protein STEHIDRAFT_133994 [Stereum hirsutum FP-91666 SS1]